MKPPVMPSLTVGAVWLAAAMMVPSTAFLSNSGLLVSQTSSTASSSRGFSASVRPLQSLVTGGEDSESSSPSNPPSWEPFMPDFEETGRSKLLRQMAEEMELQSRLEQEAASSEGLGAGSTSAPLSEPPPPYQSLKERFEAEEQRVMLSHRCAENWRYPPSTMRVVGRVPGDQQIQQVCMSEDDHVLFGSGQGFLGLADANEGSMVFGQQAHSATVTAVDYKNGWMVSGADDKVVMVHRNDNGVVKKCHELREHSHRIVSTLIVDDWRAFSASADGKIVLFSLETGEVLLEIWAGSETLACAYGDHYIFCGLLSGEVEAYSLRSGGRLAFRYRPQKMAIRSLAVQPLSSKIKVVTGGQDGLIRQFHVCPEGMIPGMVRESTLNVNDKLVLVCETTMDPVLGHMNQGFVLSGHKAPVVSLACDEEKIVSACEDGHIFVWNAQTGQRRYLVEGPGQTGMIASVHFNDRFLAVDGSNLMRLWDYSFGPPPHRASKSRRRNRGA